MRNPNPDEPEETIGEYMAFHDPARFATFEAKFVGEAPSAVWKVDRLTSVALPGVVTPSTGLQIGSEAIVIAQFRDLYGGLYSGIAWDW